MKKGLKVFTIVGVVAALSALFLFSTVSAAGQTRSFAGECDGTVLTLLNMTQAEIQAERQSGKTLAEIAAEQGVTAEALVNALMEQHRAAVQAMVTAGQITGEQGTYRLQIMEQNVIRMVNQISGTGNESGAGNGVCDGTGPISGAGDGTGIGAGNSSGSGVCDGSGAGQRGSGR
ncbi:hypothetical protein [Dehalococcoides mccartyi]|jgi:hypothetical protein|uniref:Uncharacterized protein n=2 Tax=Dehalococcoides mccartyi TaxID=61435 RepID=A0A142VAI2_9CHLR|nr:hypothetical protein [Dehalococcoides mccartyi]AGG08085.1 hypothetical protein btf_1008 [Dehalococcoides mccartyi BTF08]AII61097.1 hypothetical protein X794_04640 [Dehalococcoides mccartyi CG5]AMU86782.1 hypothetical protein Dm11a5_0956 [Dehalococcoides mccartyi]AOV99571.1 hypothetical protein DCWBC2_0944 [Dehalococcoides mccartyi]AQW62605.1 hypothetical protein B1779_04880 [Dehalococcoides mccartyi]